MTTATLLSPPPSPRLTGNADIEMDPAVAALLDGKPVDDPVPTLVWWLTAELLRTSVAVSDGLAGHGYARRESLAEAELWSDLALDELHAATGVGGVARVHGMHQHGTADRSAGAALAAAAGVRRATLALARLLVAPSASSPTALAVALARQSRALDRCRPFVASRDGAVSAPSPA